MKLHTPVSGVTSDDLIMYPAHWINVEWEHFSEKYDRWLEDIGRPSPLYCLPEEVIEGLERSKNLRPLVPDPRALAAERELSKICESVGAVGFSEGRFIHYPLLAVPRSTTVSDAFQAAQHSRLWHTPIAAREVLERLKGYAGRLVTDHLFLAEVAGLRQRWQDFPESRRPILPLARWICSNDYPVFGHSGRPEEKALEADFQVFCDKWLLAGMATWDLPVPRAPLLPRERSNVVDVLPGGMLAIVVPFFYPLLGDDSILAAIYQQQRKVARELGLDESLAALSHYRAYGQMLTIAHVERVLMDRYSRGKSTWGLVGQLEAALHAALGVGTDQIKKLRKAISACRGGKRPKWLTPRRR
jgi:hypothetical protein